MATGSIPESIDWKPGAEQLTPDPDPQPGTDTDAKIATPTAVGSELKTLVHQSSHYLAGLVAKLALGLVSFPIFTRVLSVSEYGMMDLGERLLLLLTVACKAGLQNSSLRFYNQQEFAKNKRAERRYYSTLFFGMLGTSGGVLLLFFIASLLIPKAVSLGSLANLVYLILGLSLFRAMGSVLWGFLRIEERTKTFNVLSVVAKAATIAAICAFFPWIGRTARAYFAGTLGVEALLALGLTAWLLVRGVLDLGSFKFDLFHTAVAYGAPLIIYEFAFAILGSTDRILVRHYLGADALGFYAVAYGLARNVNEFLVTPLSLALIPIYMRIWASDGAQKTAAFLTVALDIFIMASVGVLAAVAASGHAVMVILASSKYAGADRLVPVILAALVVYATHPFVAAGLLIHKRTLLMAELLVASAALNIGLNCLLLPRIGLMGGAITTLVSYLACIVSLAYASNRLLPLRLDLRSLVKYGLAALSAWVLGSQFRVTSPIVEFLVRSFVVVISYLVILYAVDCRMRDWTRLGLRWLQNHAGLRPGQG